MNTRRAALTCIRYRFLGHSYEFGPKDFIIILTGVLHFLLIGFTIYQYLPSAPKGTKDKIKRTGNSYWMYISSDVFESIGFWYLLVAVINSSVAFLWFFHLGIFAFVGLLWQLATLVFIYHRLRDYPPRNGTDHAFVNAPFSIYTAYSFFIVLWQAFQFHDQTKHNDIVCTHHLMYAMFTYLKIA